MINLIKYTFEETHTIRVIIDNTKVFFIAKDVATALGYQDPDAAIRKFCKTSIYHKQILKINVPISNKSTGYDELINLHPKLKLICELDVHSLIFKSKLKNINNFKVWFYYTLLGTIRNDITILLNSKLKIDKLNESINKLTINIKLINKKIEDIINI